MPSINFIGTTAAPTMPGPVCTPNTGEMRMTSRRAAFSRSESIFESMSAPSWKQPCSTVIHSFERQSHQRLHAPNLAGPGSITPSGLRLYTFQANANGRAFYEKNGFRAVRFGISSPPESEPDVEYHWNAFEYNTSMTINQPTIATHNGVRSTFVEVNLSQLGRNLQAIREKVSPAKVLIVIKANAYGHGLVEVAKYLGSQADYIGVAVLEEGILLRQRGVQAPILVLGGIWCNQIPAYIEHDLTLTAPSVECLEQIDQAAAVAKKKAKVHLKIDTGMERIGVHDYNAHTLQEAALRCRHVEVEGIYSHFANADAADLAHARLQLERFNEVLRFYEKRSLSMPIRHIANSGGILQLPESYFDMVRPGILLYGVYPSSEAQRTVAVEPALAWKSRVVYFKVTKAGHPVSYGSTWQSDHDVRIVTVPVGYGDGYFRRMSNRVQVIIHGKRYPQVGRVCMDQIMVNIEQDSAFNGDEVVLIGKAQNGEQIRVEELAEWADTIPYEILTNINTRVPRVYVTDSGTIGRLD